MPFPSDKHYQRKYRGWKFPTPAYVFDVHEGVLELSGGLSGFKDRGQVLSAMDAPWRTAGGEEAYPRFFDKVAAVGYFIARNHGFSDGNKRTSYIAVETTLSWNGQKTKWTDAEAILVFSLLGSGFLEIPGLRHALLLACGHDVTDLDTVQHM